MVLVNVNDFPNDAISSNDSLVRLNPVRKSLVDVYRERVFAAARSDHLRRDRLGNKFLFESQQQLQAAGLLGILTQTHLLQTHLLDLLLELAVLGSYPAQVNVVVPAV